MKKNLPLHFHISTLFLVVMIVVGVAIGLVAYNSIHEILLKSATDKSQRISLQVDSNLHGLLAPSEIAVKLLANSDLIDAKNLASRIKNLGLLQQVLVDKGGAIAVYIGYENGDFFLLRSLVSEAERHIFNAPSEASYLIQSIEHQGETLDGSYIFLDSGLRQIKVVHQPEYAKKYFPKDRPWYQSASKSSGIVITSPYLFFSNRKVGVTVVKQAPNRHGVVAVDIQLDAIGKSLEEQKPSPNAKLAVLDGKGYVIGLSQPSESLINDSSVEKNEIQLKRLNEFNTPIFAMLFEKLKEAQGFQKFSGLLKDGNERWQVNAHPFKVGDDSQFMLISAIPQYELLADVVQFEHSLLWAMLLLFLVMVPVGLLLGRAIAKPIEDLAKETDNIRELKLDKPITVNYRIKELDILGSSLNRLKKTISAFTAYIPRDLVNDLLKSDDGIQVGGESRYLTILFSDLKNFSSLSETTPARELLRRVSSYLGLMTFAIKEEGGTVDKFIGDSVMAFWGAPKLNAHHAYHAAVAAVKTKRRMVKLNAELTKDEKPPLTVRLGIHSDAVLVGNIGSSERLSYTVMGDGVNVASRLEAVNKDYETDICISHALFKEAGERLWARPIDLITVKGRKGELLIYELMGIRDGDDETNASSQEQALCKATEAAYLLYKEEKFALAAHAYEAIAVEFNDGLSRVMQQKCLDKLADR